MRNMERIEYFGKREKEEEEENRFKEIERNTRLEVGRWDEEGCGGKWTEKWNEDVLWKI